MTPVTIDAELLAKLTSNGGKVPLADDKGNTVGYYVSPDEYALMMKALYDQAFEEFTEEDMKRVLANPKRYTMDDVFKLLEGQ
jgi:hypothetical protein